MDTLKEYLKKLFKIINREEMKVLPGHLSFFLVLSLIPSITLVGIICNSFSISIKDIMEFFSTIIPKGVYDIFEPFISNSIKGSIVLYLIIGFILASNGAFAITLTSNTLYNIKNRNYLKGRIKSLFLTILLMFLFTFIIVVLAFGNNILGFILHLNIFNGISNTIYHIFVYLKWPIAFFVIYIILKLVYTITPDRKIESRTVTKGAIFTTVGWLFVTAIYSYYANNVARYDMFYGNLSNIIILMMWIYIIAYIFVVGIAINVNYYNHMEETVIDKN